MSTALEPAPPGAPRTIVVNGTGNSLAFALPPGVTIDVQSAYAVIDATAAGPTTATLTIAEQSGVVIAAKRQSEVVDAGVTGSATWALRLDDDGASAAPVATGFEAIADNTGVLVAPNTLTPLQWFKDFGSDLIQVGGSFAPSFFANGTYAVTVYAPGGVSGAPYLLAMRFRFPVGGATAQAFVAIAAANTPLISSTGPSIAITKEFTTADVLDVHVVHNAAGNVRVPLYATIEQLA